MQGKSWDAVNALVESYREQFRMEALHWQKALESGSGGSHINSLDLIYSKLAAIEAARDEFAR